MINPYETLAHAIILQAVKDYRDAQRYLKRNPKSETSHQKVNSCQRFFCSAWFEELTDMDGYKLLKALEQEVA